MYKPQDQNPGSTNSPAVTPPQPISGSLQVLAPEGHFPPWLTDEFKTMTPIQVTTYQNVAQSLEKIAHQTFDLLLIPDRTLLTAIALQKVVAFSSPWLDPKEMPLAAFLGHPFDPRNQYGIPYGFSFYGFRYHKDAIQKIITKWKDLFSEENIVQTDFPNDPEIFLHLQMIAEEVIGKSDKKVVHQTPTPRTEEESPIQVRLMSDLIKNSISNPSWKVVTPQDGSILELYHLCWGSQNPHLTEISKKIFNPILAARLSEENFYASTLKAARSLQNAEIKKVLYPEENWLNKTIFVRPPRAAKAS